MSQRAWFDKDLYKVLGVGKSASKDEIKKAYRKLAQRYHPDANSGDAEAEARFKEISEAHAVLSNDEKRKEYDQVRRFAEAGGERIYGFRPGGGGGVRINLEDLFGGAGGGFQDLFGGFGGAPDQRGADVETSVTLSFDEAVSGTTVVLGDGTKVRVPPGVTSGKTIRVRGKGRPGSGGGASGDVYVRVTVEPHPIFTLGEAGTISLTLPVTIAEAALGARIEVPTLGEPVTLKIPPGTPPGKTLRVRGKGAPRSGGGRGDLMVTIAVEIPQKLSRREKKLLEEFASEHGDSPRTHLEPFMHRPKAS